jgi:hypothetical protein
VSTAVLSISKAAPDQLCTDQLYFASPQQQKVVMATEGQRGRVDYLGAQLEGMTKQAESAAELAKQVYSFTKLQYV